MSLQFKRKTAVFVIRIWIEYLQEQPPVWRGEVSQVQTGESVYFNSLTELRQLLEAKALIIANPNQEAD